MPSGEESIQQAHTGIAGRRIQRLPPGLANQIAAGEVVERPASVVKELLENSLDAGACRIDLDVEEGGVRLIRVRDDGLGIHREDLPLALTSHATSKIRNLDDLERVVSLGFRGEALPSIASVSRLRLTSRAAGATEAWSLASNGGEVEEPPVLAAQVQGSTVEVRDLFFNTPARRKFLRAEKTEFNHLLEVVRRIALCRFDVAIRLRHNQRQVLDVRAVTEPGADRSRRVSSVCGSAFLDQAVAVDERASGLWVHGWVGSPDAARAQSNLQYFYLNGRMIRDKLVGHALRQAFGEGLPIGRYPVYVLYLEMDPSQVDVNVHPTKHEVRFREARLVHDFLVHAVSRALDGLQVVAPLPNFSSAPDGAPRASPRLAAVGRTRGGGGGSVRDAMAHYEALTRQNTPVSTVAPKSATPRSGTRTLGLVAGRYLVAIQGDDLVLVDLPAARGQLIRRGLENELRGRGVVARPLLLPVSVGIAGDQADMLEREAPMVARMGFEVVRQGPDRVAVHRVPMRLSGNDPEALVHGLLDGLAGRANEYTVIEAMARVAAASPPRPDPEYLEALLREMEEAGLETLTSTWTRLDGSRLGTLFGDR